MSPVEDDPLFAGGTGDAELAALEAALRPLAHAAPLGALPDRPRRRRWVLPVAGAVVAAAAVVIWLGVRGDAGPCAKVPGFTFSVSAGSATCGGGTVASRGTLPVGAWLETHGDAVAAVQVADVGEVTVYGDSRLRLVESGGAKQRLELARGHIAAKMTAPPRLFVVDTPAAAAVDLGCRYDLTVDAAGRTHLRVTEGAVSLEDAHGAAVYVPATFEIDLAPGRVGTPTYIDATPAMRAAVARLDAGEPGALAAVIDAADGRDRVTLWNVIARAPAPAAVAKLEALAPLPDPALHAKVLAGDADAMDIWLDVFVERGDLAHDKRAIATPRR